MTLDDALVVALEDDCMRAPISAQDRVMLDYIVELTRDATRIGPSACRGMEIAAHYLSHPKVASVNPPW